MLDFIIEHSRDDEGPYLKIDVLGKKLLGLLDSGASSTFLGGQGWKQVSGLVFKLDTNRKTGVTVTNGDVCQSVGVCTLPLRLCDKVRLIDVIVVPELAKSLIWAQISGSKWEKRLNTLTEK